MLSRVYMAEQNTVLYCRLHCLHNIIKFKIGCGTTSQIRRLLEIALQCQRKALDA
jgi:hypothetical protein